MASSSSTASTGRCFTNITRHSTAAAATITLERVRNGLRLCIRDDGGSRNGAWRPGVGLTSMRERAEELGGSCTADHDGSGGLVTVHIPLAGAVVSVRIVVADDHSVVRESLRALLSAVDGYELVGTASTGQEAVRAAVTLRPDVLVLDIQMPDLSGIEAAREVSRLAPDVAVLMLTMFDEDDSVFAAMRAVRSATCSRAPLRTRSSAPSRRWRPETLSLAPRWPAVRSPT